MGQLLITGARAAGSALVSTGRNVLAKTIANSAASYALTTAQNLIFGPIKKEIEGPRLESLRLQSSTEGAFVPIVFGRNRIAGQIIWATNFKEEKNATRTRRGGKFTRRVDTSQITYEYSISIAIGLCEGEITRINRVWADGKPFSLEKAQYRLYKGTETQAPDDLISTVEGTGDAPAYRGLAYIVFENLPLGQFGNRIPQFQFEVERHLKADDGLEEQITALTLIPASGEFAYSTKTVLHEIAEGHFTPINRNNTLGEADFVTSVKAMVETFPNLKYVSLIISWFGTDLRPSFCDVKPGVELQEKQTRPISWRVNGIERDEAHEVSKNNGAPAYGGTPSDASVIEAIQYLKKEGIEITFYPFLLMDIPHGNTLPNPEGSGTQPAYPWRGRIRAGNLDKTAQCIGAVNSFFGAAQPADFNRGEEVTYSGANEWSFRRMILHYANICELAGGVSSFLIGSELKGVTTSRDAEDNFPAVAQLKQLAEDVRIILRPETQISYAADWSEYFGYHPAGENNIFFHLDPLWAAPAIDFIGIDNYMPLADWRYGHDHLDRHEFSSSYDIAYLQSNIERGEGYDWFYASTNDRQNQVRTPITGGAYNEPWVYRYKDLKNWWSNLHHNRLNGVKQAATNWVPQSKPIVFCELGCPAIDKAANQPNVFFDQKSAESEIPYFSNGNRDDLIQRRFIEAHLSYWQGTAHNPISVVYNGPMIDQERLFVYTYDARPYPDFPSRDDVWKDSENWARGHWLNGKAGKVPLDRLIKALLPFDEIAQEVVIDTNGVDELVTGYVIDRPMAYASALQPLLNIFRIGVEEFGKTLNFFSHQTDNFLSLETKDLVEGKDLGAVIDIASSFKKPQALNLLYLEEGQDFRQSSVLATQENKITDVNPTISAPLVMDRTQASRKVNELLLSARARTKQAKIVLPPSKMALGLGDGIRLEGQDFLVSGDSAGITQSLILVGVPSNEDYFITDVSRLSDIQPVTVETPAITEILDIPLIDKDEPALAIAAFAKPWRGAVSYAADSINRELSPIVASQAALLGRLEKALTQGPLYREDKETTIECLLYSSELKSVTQNDFLKGANLLAVKSNTGEYETLAFKEATLAPAGIWHLKGLLRGLFGTEQEMRAGAALNSRVIVLNDALAEYPIDTRRIGEVLRLKQVGSELEENSGLYSAVETSISGVAYRPLSPVHLKHRKIPEGVLFTWVRRTRFDGDHWQARPIPLGESREAYKVKIKYQGRLLRELSVDEEKYLYTNENMQGDLTSINDEEEIVFEVCQMSDVYGEGRIASKTFKQT